MWGNGLNMQNIPERAKGMFIADRGYMMTYFDKSQIEARLVAYFADIPVWKEQFEQSIKYYGQGDYRGAELSSRRALTISRRFDEAGRDSDTSR